MSQKKLIETGFALIDGKLFKLGDINKDQGYDATPVSVLDIGFSHLKKNGGDAYKGYEFTIKRK